LIIHIFPRFIPFSTFPYIAFMSYRHSVLGHPVAIYIVRQCSELVDIGLSRWNGIRRIAKCLMFFTGMYLVDYL
jgi:hypothetical protein